MKKEAREVKVKNIVPKTKENADGSVTKGYEIDVLENADDIMGLLQTPEGLKAALVAINYGRDLKERVGVRAEILKAQPASLDKAIEKQAKMLMKLREGIGKPVTMEKALAMVKEQMAQEDEEEETENAAGQTEETATA